eukprot:4713614-Amphidinium_carterae.1
MFASTLANIAMLCQHFLLCLTVFLATFCHQLFEQWQKPLACEERYDAMLSARLLDKVKVPQVRARRL